MEPPGDGWDAACAELTFENEARCIVDIDGGKGWMGGRESLGPDDDEEEVVVGG